MYIGRCERFGMGHSSDLASPSPSLVSSDNAQQWDRWLVLHDGASATHRHLYHTLDVWNLFLRVSSLLETWPPPVTHLDGRLQHRRDVPGPSIVSGDSNASATKLRILAGHALLIMA